MKKKTRSRNKEIRRAPIVLNKNTVALIHIFEKYDDLEDMWMHDLDKYMIENYEEHEKAAKQFISQLEGHYCVLFMENLIKEAFKAITKGMPLAFKKEHAEKLINELKEITDKREK